MGSTTTAFCTSAKQQLMQGQHNLSAQVTPTGTPTNGAFTLTSMSSVAGISVGDPASGTNVAAGAVVASIDSASQVTLSKSSSGSPGSVTITINGDTFAFALIKNACTGTYGAASTNYSNITGNSDEVSGTGYVAGGYVWANNSPTGPTTSGTTAYASFGANPTWTSATIDAQGGMLYNQSNRGAGLNAALGVYDFGGEQKVTGGTFTVLLPTNDSTHALLRLQ